MSKIYHGSIEEVKRPEIRHPNHSLDYGSGFYTTTSYEQAKRWVERKMNDKDVSVGYVYGPVADDSVYTQFMLYEGGIISMSTLIQELKTYKLVDQYLFHTEKSLLAIKFVESIRITR